MHCAPLRAHNLLRASLAGHLVTYLVLCLVAKALMVKAEDQE